MIILGINFSHDASVVIIHNGKLVAAIEEEKISRFKQDFGWPNNAIQRLFHEYSLKPEYVDFIAFGSKLFSAINKNEIKYRFNRNKLTKNFEYLDRITSFLTTSNPDRSFNTGIFETELKKLGFINAKVVFYDHHYCHAASAWYSAPFVCDLIMTSDGHGDGTSTAFFEPDEKEGIKSLQTYDYSKSIGQFYSSITKILGFRANRHEGKITGLAGFGKPSSLLEKFRGLFNFSNGTLTRFPFNDTKQYWNKYGIKKKLDLKAKINLFSENNIGQIYAKNSLILEEWLKEETKGFSKEDIAYACQKVTEEVIMQLLDFVITEFKGGRKVTIAVAGGLFANVRVNQLIMEHPLINNIFIQPAMGDAGVALGAAILSDIEFHGNKLTNQYRFNDTYFGPFYSSELDSFINSIDEKLYSIRNLGKNSSIEIAQLLKNNTIIGFWQNRLEWGPRALGNRSMILNTFDRSVNNTLNKRLKRTEFMPFAPSVLDFMAEIYMPKYKAEHAAADYMTVTYDVDPQYFQILQAVVHVDGTARPQVVRKDINPYFYSIIEEYYKLTGCGAIVNTSFNVHEEPIVSSPETAFKALMDSRIDALVLEHYLIIKK